jgi:hypothetical protein
LGPIRTARLQQCTKNTEGKKHGWCARAGQVSLQHSTATQGAEMTHSEPWAK